MRLTRIRFKIPWLLLTAALIGGCVAAPVQEMSDARQAIQAATQAGAASYSPGPLAKAQALMEVAEKRLELGEFSSAREAAVSAKRLALAARVQAMEQRNGGGR